MKKISKYILLLSYTIFINQTLIGQTYQDHFGTGNDVGVTVYTSDNQGTENGANLLNGTDLLPDLKGASRFLGQASLGANYEEIEYVSQIGIEAWIDEQMAMPASSYLTTYQNIYEEAITQITAVHGTADMARRSDYLNFAFYEKVLKEEDVLRHKVAFALSQIFVVSLENGPSWGFGHSSYYDLLYQGAFGNFHDLLTDVTLHPIMGMYLSHFKNAKADPLAGTLPDENYAREIMQLFTIGLFEMNLDGTSKKDVNGGLIPTYDIVDVQKLAKVFTGLSGAARDTILYPQYAGDEYNVNFNMLDRSVDLTVPMKMYDEYHEQGTKEMIDGTIIPAGQLGMQDIIDALQILFNHDNVAPFISIRLIQQLVKSNPTPEYIERVASVFEDNGQGVKGDLGAVIKAILTDTEARDCTWIDDPMSGKLKQPLERLLQLYRGFDIDSPSGKFWFRDRVDIYEELGQSFLNAPTVFNFFTPFYAENDYVAPNEMVSPAFQILHSTTSIKYINLVEYMLKTRPFYNRTGVNPNPSKPKLTVDINDDPFLDFTGEINEYDTNGINALIDRVDLILCHGRLSIETKTIIADAITQNLANVNSFDSQDVINDVIYFIMISPDYIILR